MFEGNTIAEVKRFKYENIWRAPNSIRTGMEMITFPSIAKSLCFIRGHKWNARILHSLGFTECLSVRKCRRCFRKEILSSMGVWNKYSDAEFKQIVKVEF